MPKTKAELRAENEYLRRSNVVIGIVSILNNIIRWTAVVLLVRYAYLGVAALAGKVTLADIGVNVLGSVTVSQTVAWILGGGGMAYGWQQRKLRRDTVERLQSRVQEFERQKDPRRSSSGLTTRGDTRPEDRI